MKVTAKFAYWASIVFALFCVAYAGFGFSSTDASLPEDVRADAQGYAWFWLFLGGVGAVSAILSRLMLAGRFGPLDE